MASITLKDYLASLSTKGSISDGDLLPLLDSDSSNAIKTITKGTLVTLSDIDGFTEFSQSLRADIDTTLQVSASSEVTSVETRADIIGLQTYTSSLKQAISVSGTDVQIIGDLRANEFHITYVSSSVLFTTGSNKFGDAVSDIHEFSGSVKIKDTLYLQGEPIGTLQLNAQTASQATVNTGLSEVTGAFATELGDLQSNVTDFTNVLSGVSAVSGAIVTELAGIQNNISSFNNVFSGVSAVTGAFATELGQLQTQNTSQSSVNSGISAVTGAFATELGEIQTQLTNRRGELNGLEAYTASLKSVGLISSSAQISVEISGSGFTSASGEFAELTLTKGDGTTTQVDLSPRKVLELVKNKESQTLAKGTPVYVSGSTGNAAHIYAASASRADRMPAAFVLNEDLAFDAEGYGIVVGYINGVNTSGFNEGDNVYVGESGGYTNVKPTGNSNRIQKLGNVIKVDAVNGSGVITGAGRSNDVPNIQEGYMWVGGPNDVSYQLSTSSLFSENGDTIFSGSILISGSVIPSTNLGSYTSSFSLGSDTNAWKELWVSNGSVNFVNPNTGETASISLTDDNRISISEFETVGNLTVTGSMSVAKALNLFGKSTSPNFNGANIAHIQFENGLIYTNDSNGLVIHNPYELYFDLGNWGSAPNFVNITGSLRLNTPAVAGEGWTPNPDLTSLIVGGKSEFSSSLDVSGSVTINDILVLEPRTTTPSSPISGSFIVSGSGSTIKPFFWDGNQWQEVAFV